LGVRGQNYGSTRNHRTDHVEAMHTREYRVHMVTRCCCISCPGRDSPAVTLPPAARRYLSEKGYVYFEGFLYSRFFFLRPSYSNARIYTIHTFLWQSVRPRGAGFRPVESRKDKEGVSEWARIVVGRLHTKLIWHQRAVTTAHHSLLETQSAPLRASVTGCERTCLPRALQGLQLWVPHLRRKHTYEQLCGTRQAILRSADPAVN
jgi:hypothetical protein